MDDIRRLTIIAAEALEAAGLGKSSGYPQNLQSFERPLAIADEAACAAELARGMAKIHKDDARKAEKCEAAASACESLVRECFAAYAAGRGPTEAVDALAAAERRAKVHLLASMRHLVRAETAE